jgi:DNA-binding transcriptional LysR family regulator
VFAVVVRAGSISKAALELGMTAGAVSRRLDNLEQRLGVKLLRRNGQGVTLTERGLLGSDLAQSLHRLSLDFARTLSGADARAEGTVTIAAPDGFATYCIAPHVGAFQDAYPGIALVLDCGFWTEFSPNNPRDIVLTYDERDRRLDDVWTPAAIVHFCTFAAPSYLDRRGRPTKLSELVAHRLNSNLSLSFQPQRWGARSTALRELVTYNFLTNCAATTLQATIAGAGIGAMPSYMMPFADNRLEMVFERPFSAVQLWMVTHRDAMKSARVRTVFEWLQSIFDPASHPWFREEFVHPRDFFPEPADAPRGGGRPRRRVRRG